MKTFSATFITAALLVSFGLCAEDVDFASEAEFASTQTLYGQCGGKTWTGPTACPTGTACQEGNEWFSQCLTPGNEAAQDTNSGRPAGGKGKGKGRPGGAGGPPGPPPFVPPYQAPPYQLPPSQQPVKDPPVNGGNDGGSGGDGGDDGDGGTVVTQILTTIYNVGPNTISTQITYLSQSAPPVTKYRRTTW